MRLLVAHQGRLRAFLRSLLPSWDDVDEVMQEASLVAWRKFANFEEGSNFMAWAATIARFEALRHLRTRSRDRLVFSDGVCELLADEAANDGGAFEREQRALERCLARLGEAPRDLLLLSYQPGVKRHEIAARVGRSVEGYYKTVQRLRSRLLDCIRRELAEEPA